MGGGNVHTHTHRGEDGTTDVTNTGGIIDGQGLADRDAGTHTHTESRRHFLARSIQDSFQL